MCLFEENSFRSWNWFRSDLEEDAFQKTFWKASSSVVYSAVLHWCCKLEKDTKLEMEEEQVRMEAEEGKVRIDLPGGFHYPVTYRKVGRMSTDDWQATVYYSTHGCRIFLSVCLQSFFKNVICFYLFFYMIWLQHDCMRLSLSVSPPFAVFIPFSSDCSGNIYDSVNISYHTDELFIHLYSSLRPSLTRQHGENQEITAPPWAGGAAGSSKYWHVIFDWR